MKSPTGPRTPKPPIRRLRPSYSCTECTRRKLRCSKHIPCFSCIERGIESQCRLRHRVNEGRRGKDSRNQPENSIPETQPVSSEGLRPCETEHHLRYNNVSDTSLPGALSVTPEASTESKSHPTCSQKRHKILDTVSQDAAVTLEFLAFSRQQILNTADFNHSNQQTEDGYVSQAIDFLFTAAQVEKLMAYHEEYIAWIHNVVHMPTFREQCKDMFQLSSTSNTKQSWLSLYYSMLSVTLYHTHPSKLQDFEIYSGVELSLLCYQKSIDSLNAVDFMKNHSIYSVQAICLLIYIGHNSGQSDRISVLLASASRIAQCLGIHRLGSETPFSIPRCDDSDTRSKLLIDREVSKRAWWFLVRQDWLQIPFNNTYNIHPSQFDTEMPKNCDEDVSKMGLPTDIVEQSKDYYTQGSYTSVLNKGSVIIWKLQDRMCKQTKSGSGHSGDDLRNLYSEVLQSDRELKQLVDGMPRFFRLKENLDGETPRNIVQQNRVLSISIAHKFYCIHRHFQIMSLKDPWFAYTKVSCLPLMRRYLMDFLSLPDHPDTHIVSNLWTVNAQVLTAAVWLLFELIFSKDENEQIFETHEIRDLALRSLQFLQVNQSKSTIAKRGVGLIESLLDTEQAIKAGTRKQFSLKEIISRVEVESDSGSNVAMELSSDPCVSHVSDLLLGDNMAWEDIFSVFDM